MRLDRSGEAIEDEPHERVEVDAARPYTRVARVLAREVAEPPRGVAELGDLAAARESEEATEGSERNVQAVITSTGLFGTAQTSTAVITATGLYETAPFTIAGLTNTASVTTNGLCGTAPPSRARRARRVARLVVVEQVAHRGGAHPCRAVVGLDTLVAPAGERLEDVVLAGAARQLQSQRFGEAILARHMSS